MAGTLTDGTTEIPLDGRILVTGARTAVAGDGFLLDIGAGVGDVGPVSSDDLTAAIAAHESESDPHSPYHNDARGDARYLPLAHEADTTAVHGISNTADLVLTGDSRLSDARTPTAHAINAAGGFHTGTLDKSQQHAQTSYLDGATGQTFANRTDFAAGVNIGSVSGTAGRVLSSAGNTNGFSITGRNGTTFAFCLLNEAGAPFLRVANSTTTVDLPGAATVGTTLTVGTNIILTSPTTAATATAGAQTLPANPVGFLVISIAGTSRKIPYYAT